ncbi:MAG: DUF5331 domain-containing protein [Nostoc sp. DedQUE08]|uniref:DUF5331 domain-containing protein n=1 Tax=unclassified Nostoc TaxID=2593658 RepID=UPI002AD36D20|nr:MULTISPECIES: DUF5331 domain-containing protein [unclassified Nostoc]MDZ8065854.1 DUF5331 domain-containing protein [Nostoc sp. DedQUE08]MDZ8093421.1 DUF5331 domain-containing protein [Nostoc sp. DedQUE05]MDZ8129059.1 DUF5331 domain-containing protein [Nostoc sp. DedQUE07]
MAFFHSFTDSIKQKWLQFFQNNRDWITLHMEVESVYTPDGGKRPPSYLILGVLNALEPKLAQLMLPFAKLNPDADTLIEVLDLHFDPDLALGNRFVVNPDAEKYVEEAASVIDEKPEDETLTHAHTNGFVAVAVVEEFTIVDSEDESLGISELEETENGFGDISLTNGHNSKDESLQSSSLEADEFGEIAFDTTAATEVKLDEDEDEALGDSPLDENAFKDVLSDVWGDETALQKAEENNDFLGEELPAGVFDESEIARLFPNA